MLNNYRLYCSQRDVGGIRRAYVAKREQIQLHIILMLLSSGLTVNRLIIAALPTSFAVGIWLKKVSTVTDLREVD